MTGRKDTENLPLVALLILLGWLGCGQDDSRAEQARALLEGIAALDPGAPADQRARRIEGLRALPVKDAELARVRDACVLAHAGLLAAETEQAGVRQRLDRVGDAGLAPSELAQIAAALRQASERLRDAQGALPECEAHTRALLARPR